MACSIGGKNELDATKIFARFELTRRELVGWQRGCRPARPSSTNAETTREAGETNARYA
jgi:hypothetical protein